LSVSAVVGLPFSLFSAGSKTQAVRAPPNPRRDRAEANPQSSPDTRGRDAKGPAPAKPKECRIDIADFLNTTSFADHIARFPYNDNDAIPAVNSAWTSNRNGTASLLPTFPRSPYGPLSLDMDGDEDETRSCPSLKRGHMRGASKGQRPKTAPNTPSPELQHARSISALGFSLGWKNASSSSPPTSSSSPRASSSSPRVSYSHSDSQLGPRTIQLSETLPLRSRCAARSPAPFTYLHFRTITHSRAPPYAHAYTTQVSHAYTLDVQVVPPNTSQVLREAQIHS
jgi:hypothetical protein